MKIKKDDIVKVIAGKYKGTEGKVLRTIAKKDQVVVEGVNIRTRHIKKTAQRAGQIVQYEAPIHVSNVMALDPKSGKVTRIGYTVDKKGKKERVARKSGETITVSKGSGKKDSKKETKKESK